MEKYTQQVLPGTVLRMIVAVTWVAADAPSKVSVVVDLPSDLYSTQLHTHTITDVLTVEELDSVVSTMASEGIREMTDTYWGTEDLGDRVARWIAQDRHPSAD